MEKDIKTEPKKEETKSKLYPDYYDYPIPFDPEIGMDVFTPPDTAPHVEDIDKEFKLKNSYMNNTKLMRAAVDFPYTAEQLQELAKCEEDIIYFIVNYCKIITLKGGIELFKLFQYQKNAIKVVHENRFSIFKFPRQMGKCVDPDTPIEIRINSEDEYKITIAQLYEMIEVENQVDSYTPNYDYQILTEEGFKDFDGITSKKADRLIEITLDNKSSFRVTPDHEVKNHNGLYVKAIDLKVGDILGIKDQHSIIKVDYLCGDFTVADVISVQDTQSFTINGIGDIRDYCVDENDQVVLFDHETGDIIEVHIDELDAFLSKHS